MICECGAVTEERSKCRITYHECPCCGRCEIPQKLREIMRMAYAQTTVHLDSIDVPWDK